MIWWNSWTFVMEAIRSRYFLEPVTSLYLLILWFVTQWNLFPISVLSERGSYRANIQRSWVRSSTLSTHTKVHKASYLSHQSVDPLLYLLILLRSIRVFYFDMKIFLYLEQLNKIQAIHKEMSDVCTKQSATKYFDIDSCQLQGSCCYTFNVTSLFANM